MRPGQIVRLACPPDTEHSSHHGALGLILLSPDAAAPSLFTVLVNGFIIRVHDGWLDPPGAHFPS